MLEVIRNWLDRYLSDEEALLLALIVVALFAVILTMGAILAPLLSAIVLAYVLLGIVKLLTRYRMPEFSAVLLTFLVFLGGFIAFLVLVIPRVWRQMQRLYDELPGMMARAREALESLVAAFPNLVTEQQALAWSERLDAGAGEIGEWIVSFSLEQLPVVVTGIVYMALVPILVFFLLKDKDKLLAWCAGFLPSDRPLINRVAEEMDSQMSNYVRGKFLEFLIVGSVTYILFLSFGLGYAALLAFLVGLSVIVPYLGIAVVTVPVVFIAYLQFGWGGPFIYLMLAYAIIQSLDGLLLVPLLFSEANDLHPIAIIVAVLVFGSWWGIWGVFFAIPLMTLIKAIVSAWPSPQAASSSS